MNLQNTCDHLKFLFNSHACFPELFAASVTKETSGIHNTFGAPSQVISTPVTCGR